MGRDSQLAELLAGLPGVRSYPADGVVAEVELLQSQEAVKPALTHLRQVVVVQLPAGPQHTHTGLERVQMKSQRRRSVKALTGLPWCSGPRRLRPSGDSVHFSAS